MGCNKPARHGAPSAHDRTPGEVRGQRVSTCSIRQLQSVTVVGTFFLSSITIELRQDIIKDGNKGRGFQGVSLKVTCLLLFILMLTITIDNQSELTQVTTYTTKNWDRPF